MSGVIAASTRTTGPPARPADPEHRPPIACGQPRHGSARMPKSFAEYSADDWRHLRPVTQAVKSLRYRAIDRGYRRKPARAGDTAALAESIRGRRVLVTIAFDDPALIRWQIRLVRHFVPGVRHLVVDNSAADDAANEIQRIAGAENYLRAPQNPWSGDAASRSHGIVLNWAWDNLIRPGEPEAFGFLDHDIFPTAPDNPFAPFATQDIYGVVRTVGRRWFLWAGFCLFRFAAVKNEPLDFGQDWFAGLDTGGGNWSVLYRHIDVATLAQPQTSFIPFKPGIAVADGPLQWCGTWLHEIGLMGAPPLFAEKRRVLAAMLAPHLEATRTPLTIDAS
jgi:hypothetical protein